MIGRLEKPVLNPAHETLKINLLNFTLECNALNHEFNASEF